MTYDVTIGIPVYRSDAFLHRTLASALAQTYPSIEFLLVDDAGGDNSLAIMQEIQQTHPRGAAVRIISHDSNQGVSASRNQLIDEARGDYLYFMDSDDVIVENVIEILMQAIRQYDAEIAFGSYEKIELSGKRVVFQYPSLQLLGEGKLAEYAYRKYGGIQASACNFLVKTSVLRDRHHRFIAANYWEDLVFTFDLVTMVSRAVLLPEVTYTYRCREDSLSHYHHRTQIAKEEVVGNIRSIEHLKRTSSALCDKPYYPNRCLSIAMTDFYIVCSILKRGKSIVPAVSAGEMKAALSHTASFRDICSFRQSRWSNLAFYMLGRLPAPLCLAVIWWIGKFKKLL